MEEQEDVGSPSLRDLGEREIVRRLIAEYPQSSFIGPGDDCGAIELDERLLLLSTDTKVDDTHFPSAFTPFDKGWTITAANLSDVAAMGGIPVGFLIAFGLPRDTPFFVLKDIEGGIDACLRENSTPLVGADTKENKVLTLTGTIVGIVDKREVLLRRGSRPGDIVCVSGPLGGAALGLDSMKGGLNIALAEARLRRPTPRIKEGRLLAKSGHATSCIDISDGLSSSLYELMRASGNGFEIDAAHVPLHESLVDVEITDRERLDIALHSGDEYELLFTLMPDGVEALSSMFDEEATHDLSVIGRVVEGKEINLIHPNGEGEHLLDLGYEHFRS